MSTLETNTTRLHVDAQHAAATTRERLALAVLLTAGFTLAVDFSILNVALPAIGDEVGISLGQLQWIATSFALCAAGFTLLCGRLADLFGRRRMFTAGVALLGVSSLTGGLATVPWLLLTARALQGTATAIVVPAALSLLTTTFPQGPRREKALGLNGALMAAGFTTGAILGGVLTDVASWRWAFFANVVVAAGVLAVAPFVLTESRPAARPALDLPGAFLVTGGLLAIVRGLTVAGELSWRAPAAWVPLLVGTGLLACFWLVEARVAEPLVPIGILARRDVAWGNAAGVLAFATETSLVFVLTVYLQKVLHYSPLATGLAFAVLGAGTVVGGVVAPRVIAALDPTRALVGGLVVQAAATAPLAFVGAGHGWIGCVLAATFVGGVANLVAIVAFMVTATSGVPDERQGAATGLTTMSQQVGITMGIPVMSAVMSARALPSGETTASVLAGVSTAISVNGAACLVAAVCVAVLLPARGRRSRGCWPNGRLRARHGLRRLPAGRLYGASLSAGSSTACSRRWRGVCRSRSAWWRGRAGWGPRLRTVGRSVQAGRGSWCSSACRSAIPASGASRTACRPACVTGGGARATDERRPGRSDRRAGPGSHSCPARAPAGPAHPQVRRGRLRLREVRLSSLAAPLRPLWASS